MASLLRFLDKPGLWSDLDDSLPIDASTSLEILVEIGARKGRGASYFRVDPSNVTHLHRAIAGYISSQSALKAVHYGIISENDVLRLNVSAVQTTSLSADVDLGKQMHFDLNVTVHQAIEVAQIIRPTITVVSVTDVKKHLFWSIDQGFVKIGLMNKDLILKLAKNDEFAIQHIATSVPVNSLTVASNLPTPAIPDAPTTP